jgi:hypothetical protein
MTKRTIAKALRRLGTVAPLLVLCTAQAVAQTGYPPSGSGSSARSQICLRLESQLAAVDRGIGGDPAKAEQIKRYEDAAAKQQAELDRLGQQSQRQGCQGGGFFSLFSGQSPQCGPVNNQIQQMRANLDRTLTEIQRLQGNSGEREGQRRGILASLGQNDCGQQYRQYANAGPGGFFDALFGGGGFSTAAPDAPLAGTYRTLCVRTCDGYYFPVSYSTVPGRFADDEQACHRMCPATDVALYTHRNPGEDVGRAVSMSGRSYSELPTAFGYRKQYNAACSCRAPGQSWADALRQGTDQTVERGDIVVTEERARQLSQPRFDAQGKPVKPEAGRGPISAASTATATPTPGVSGDMAAAPVAEDMPEEVPSGKRKVRAVGPNAYPVR